MPDERVRVMTGPSEQQPHSYNTMSPSKLRRRFWVVVVVFVVFLVYQIQIDLNLSYINTIKPSTTTIIFDGGRTEYTQAGTVDVDSVDVDSDADVVAVTEDANNIKLWGGNQTDSERRPLNVTRRSSPGASGDNTSTSSTSEGNTNEVSKDSSSDRSSRTIQSNGITQGSPSKKIIALDSGRMTKQQQKRVVSIVVNLSGELGNNLHHIAHGIGLQDWLRQDFHVESNIVIRHFGSNSRGGKWKKAWNDIRNCFPVLSTWDFTLGNSKEFERLEGIQKDWLKGRHDEVIGLVNSPNLSDVKAGLYRLSHNILHDPTKPKIRRSSSSPIQVPFIVSFTILDAFPVIDRHFEAVRDVFVFNHSNPKCCARLPTPDETVFHFRNYMSELPDWKAYSMGFAELSPTKTAYEVFSRWKNRNGSNSTNDDDDEDRTNGKNMIVPRLLPGDKVTVVSRVPNKYARAYAERLDEVWRTNATLLRYDQSGIQDFCYLMHTQHELVGNGRSTYLFWAAALGQAKTARLYHVDNFGLRRKFPTFWTRFTYSWTNPDLRQRIKWEKYNSEEVDEKDGPLNHSNTIND
jgi:hypothetical protein